MTAQSRPVAAAAARSTHLRRQLGRDLRDARVDRNLALRDISNAIGLSAPYLSRIERGVVPGVPIETIGRVAAAVGLDLSLKLYPAGPPIRDAAHVALLARLRGRLHRSLRMRTEIPLPIRGDKRAWDAVIEGPEWWIPVEAETKPRDHQALDRRIALKQRDAEAAVVILLLLDSRHNRAFVRLNEPALAERYPAQGRRVLELLEAGIHPGASALVFL